ncbi:beta-hexosaminidase [bacterium BMS3Bbin03]|nr:beta-hexosaminidase [bacterium BMS3Bbin03]
MRTFEQLFLSAVVILFLTGVVFAKPEKQKAGPGVIPTPQKWDYQSGEFTVTPGTKIILKSESIKPTDTAVQELETVFKTDLKLTLKIVRTNIPEKNAVVLMKANSSAGKSWLRAQNLSFNPEMEEEGYFLKISPEKVVVVGKSDQGLFYGVISLIQLIRASGTHSLRAVLIQDWPALKFRGISDDMARGQVSTLKNLKEIIRFSAYYKMNTFMPYLEDLFTSKKYPAIGKGRGRLSPKEVRELQNYAKKYFVQVIPIFELLGHSENILIQPQFAHLAEFPGAASLNTTNPETYKFLKTIIQELAHQFVSPYFNAGLDESWDVGKGKSKRFVKRYNIATVHVNHYKKVYRMLKKQGKTMIMYGDIILRNPEILTQLPKDIIIMDWHYNASANFPSVEFFARTGRKFLISPGVSDWLRIFPDLTNALVNIKYYTQKGAMYGALGSIVSTWGDYGAANFKELDWLGFAFGADCAWNPEKADVEQFRRQFTTQFYGGDFPEIESAYTLLTETAARIQYRDVWRHPFAPTSTSSGTLLKQSVNCRNTASDVQKLIQTAKPNVSRNAGQLDYMAFSARLTGWYGRRLETVVWWKQLLFEYILPKDRSKFRNTAAQKFRKMGSEIADLGQEYKQLWLRNDKKANLQWILLQFNRQKAFWDIKADQVEQGIYEENPTIPSQFIYFPAAADNGTIVPLAYFRKGFELREQPKKALLQVINNGVANSYVNGKKIGESVVRRTASMTVQSQWVKVYDVTRRLRRGKNLLSFEVRNYDPAGKAGVNVYLWLVFPDDSTTAILSDMYWKSANEYFKNWEKLNFDDSAWFNPVTRPFRRFIPRPYFKYNLPSWVE